MVRGRRKTRAEDLEGQRRRLWDMADPQRVLVRERLEVCTAFGIWWSSKTLGKEIAGWEEWAPGHMAVRVEGREVRRQSQCF